jgi:hypothetical protein
VQTAGGIQNDDVTLAGNCRVDRIVSNSRRIAARLRAHELGPGTFCPDAELVDRARTKRVASAEEHAPFLGAQARSELSNERGLPRSIYTEHEDDGRPRVPRKMQCAVTAASAERGLEVLGKRVAELCLGRDQPALRATIDVINQPHRHRDAKVGFEQHLLEALERTAVWASLRKDSDVEQCDVLDTPPDGTAGVPVGARVYHEGQLSAFTGAPHAGG